MIDSGPYREALSELNRLLDSSAHWDEPQMMSAAQAFLDEHLESEKSQEIIRLPDWPLLTNALAGLRKNEFTILCGPTGAGKSAFLTSLVKQVRQQKKIPYILFAETGYTDFIRRMLGILANENFSILETEQQKQKYREAKIKYESFFREDPLFPVAKYTSRVPIRRLLCDLLIAHKEYGVDVAILDNLNFFLDPNEFDNDIRMYDSAVHDIVMFAKNISMHVILVMHPRKTVDGRIESEFDIKGSSTAVQEASNILLMNRLAKNSEYNSEPNARFIREIKFAKIRRQGRSTGLISYFEFTNKGYLQWTRGLRETTGIY